MKTTSQAHMEAAAPILQRMKPAVARTWARLAAVSQGPNLEISTTPRGVHQRILSEGLFEANGAFRHLIGQPIPKALAWIERDGRIVAYAMATPFTEEFFAYVPTGTRAHSLGLLGVWVHPDYRRRGLAREALSLLGGAFKSVRKDLFYFSAEPRTCAIGEAVLPLYLLPRWAWAQPSPQQIRRNLDCMGQADDDARRWEPLSA